MRIVVAHSQLNTFGGGERSVLALLQYLSRRHDVTLWAGKYDPNRTFADFRHFQRRDVAPAGWLLQTPVADAVVTHTFGAHLLALRHIRTICYVHTLRSVYLHGGISPGLFARRHLDSAALRRAALVATNSAYTASRARRRYGRAVEVVPPGADHALFDIPPQSGTYALYVGRLSPEKGVERLIRWCSSLPFDLMLAGTGDPGYIEYLRSLAGPRTSFRGPLTGDALLTAYAGCRFLAFLPYEEEFGLAALEAMAAAKPVLAVPEGGLLELIRSGETGLLVRDSTEFETAALQLREDEALALRLGRAGRERARAYSWERYGQSVEALCQAAVEQWHPDRG